MTTTPSSPSDAPEPTAREDTVSAECARIITHLASLDRRHRTGDLAELRRLERRGGGPPPEAFWALVERARIAQSRERFWESLIPMMVTCPHRRGARCGRVLREQGVAASRIERWLRLGAEDAPVELRKLLRRADAIDWVDLASLLALWDHRELGDELKRRFARSYFLHRPAPTAAPSSAAPSQSRA